VEPTPFPPRESFRAAPLLAHEASYFAASARISSLRVMSMLSWLYVPAVCAADFSVLNA
jgi:hypothetical protein